MKLSLATKIVTWVIIVMTIIWGFFIYNYLFRYDKKNIALWFKKKYNATFPYKYYRYVLISGAILTFIMFIGSVLILKKSNLGRIILLVATCCYFINGIGGTIFPIYHWSFQVPW